MMKHLKALKSYASTYVTNVKKETSTAFNGYIIDGSGNFPFPGAGMFAAGLGAVLGFGYGLASVSVLGLIGGTIGGAVGLFTLGAACIAGEKLFLAHPKAKQAYKDSLTTQPKPSVTNAATPKPAKKTVPAQGTATSDFKNGGKGVTPAKQNTVEKKVAPKAPQSK